MSRHIISLVEMSEYLEGVMKKAHHHSPNITEIIPVIIGNVLIYCDIDQIHVGEREGDMKNEMWFCIKGTENWFYLSYNHEDETIDMKEDGRQGNIIAKFENHTPPIMVKAIFEKEWRTINA